MIELNAITAIYLIAYILSVQIAMAANALNAMYQDEVGRRVPDPFVETIDQTILARMASYTRDTMRFGLVRNMMGKLLFLVIVVAGPLPWLADHLTPVSATIAGLAFFAVPGIALFLIDLPFGYYRNFVIEEKYGFNLQTRRSWASDLVKSLFLNAILLGLLLAAILTLIDTTGPYWWLWAWGVFFAFQLILAVIYPTLIAPIFNTFTPIENPDLRSAIESLAAETELGLKGIYQMDATRRTRHSNAYFTGLGKAKRIVLFDSLIDSHNRQEILAILAHEIGHLKKHHIKKQLLFMSVMSLVLFYAAHRIMDWPALYSSFGFVTETHYVGLFLVMVLWDPVWFFLSPLFHAQTRRYEREADRFGAEMMKSGAPLAQALKEMARQNLSNLTPHPLYVLLNYSHPPLLERIERLERYPDGRSE